MVDLQKHSYRLAQMLKELSLCVFAGLDCEEHYFMIAGDWLELASGIETLQLITARFDDSLMYCGNARDYEDKRSLLLSEVATRLSIFNFIWGGLESVVKVINPDPIPNCIKKRRNSIDDTIYYLKNNYDPNPRLQAYDDGLCKLHMLMSQVDQYRKWLPAFGLQPFLSSSGLGLHIIRLIRNDFAHGSASLPMPDDWGPGEMKETITSQEKQYLDIIDTSSRLLLLTQQMLLMVYLKDKNAHSELLKYEGGFEFTANAATVVAVLHKVAYPEDRYQLPLFEVDLVYTNR